MLLNDGAESQAKVILDGLLAHGDRPFSHAGVDQVALAVAIGLEKLRSSAAAESFASRFLNEQRRDLAAPPRLLLTLAS